MGAFFNLFVPKQAVGANLVYFDLFNASGSASNIHLHYCVPVVSGAVAVVGVVGIDVLLTRTSAVGTGGTAATLEGTDITAATFCNWHGSASLNPNITARLSPTGGGTAGAILDYYSMFGEETSSAAYVPAPNMARVSGIAEIPPIKIVEGSGVRGIQGAVAATGNVAWVLMFEVVPK